MANDPKILAQGYAPDAYPSPCSMGNTDMTPREQAAYDAGLHAALDMARITAITIEAAPGPLDLRMQAAVGALYAFRCCWRSGSDDEAQLRHLRDGGDCEAARFLRRDPLSGMLRPVPLDPRQQQQPRSRPVRGRVFCGDAVTLDHQREME